MSFRLFVAEGGATRTRLIFFVVGLGRSRACFLWVGMDYYKLPVRI